MRLRTSLALLAIATAAPLVVFALLAANLVVKQENESVINAANARNHATISAVDGIVLDAINTLRALTVIPSLEQDDVRAFHAVAMRVLATQSKWNNLLLHDPEGRQLVNASLPWGTALLEKPVAPESIAKAVATQQPAVDNLTTAPLLRNQLSIPVRVPVVRNGKTVYVLTAALAPEAFQSLLAAQDMPSNWVSGLVDGRGRLIARVPTQAVGTMAGPDYLRHVSEGAREGWYRGKTLEGADTYTAYMRSNLTGWTIGYALPAALVAGEWQHAGFLMSMGVILSLTAAMGIGFWLSRRIATPMSQLAQAARGIGSNAKTVKIRSAIDEVTALSAALNGAAVDLAERDRLLRQSEQELRQQAAELSQANTNKRHFLALLSHELRNPLAPLRTGLAILDMRPDAKTAAETQAMMTRQVAHMARLIDDLLDVSRIDRGVLELRRDRVAIDSIVRSAVETMQPELESKHQQLVVRYAPTPMHVDGDPVRLSQVLSNLLSNASKFTPRGGTVEITTRLEDGEVVIAVSDNGIGFAEADSRRIFDMFVQLNASGSQSVPGLGIGLTIVRSLVEMHGGRIDARSAGFGQGATFTVRLPALALPEAAAPVAVPESGSLRTRRVLVVDDNVDAADSMAQMLQLHGFDARAAYDGQRALELAQSFRPEVAFIDLNMPGMGGIDLARALRAGPLGAGLDLIAVTGMAHRSDVDATRAAGFQAHLTKPALPEDVIRLAGGHAGNVIPLHGSRSAS